MYNNVTAENVFVGLPLQQDSDLLVERSHVSAKSSGISRASAIF